MHCQEWRRTGITYEDNKHFENAHPWAHRWAQRLANDIHQSPQFVMELEQLTARMPENPRENMRSALSWMVTAYYEHLKGRWTEDRMQKQIAEAEELMQRGVD